MPDARLSESDEQVPISGVSEYFRINNQNTSPGGAFWRSFFDDINNIIRPSAQPGPGYRKMQIQREYHWVRDRVFIRFAYTLRDDFRQTEGKREGEE